MNKEKKQIIDCEMLRLEALKKYAPLKENWSFPDKALFSPKMIFNVENIDAHDLRLKAIKYSFNQHYTKSFFYNKFCKDLEVKPNDIKTEKDFHKIPLISDILFKDHPEKGAEFLNWLNKIYIGDFPDFENIEKKIDYDKVIDLFQKENTTLVYSSGTSGTFSFVPKDLLTWNRQMYVCSRIFEFSPYSLKSPDSTVIWLGPRPNMTHMYIGRLPLMLLELFGHADIYFGIDRELTTKIIKLLMGSEKGLHNRIKSGLIKIISARQQNKTMERLIQILEKKENGGEIVIGGTPFFIDMFMKKILEQGLKFNIEKGIVITAGGWKRFSGMKLPEEELHDKINSVFGIPKQNCRDIYGMAECTALNVSCEGHYKHIPHSIVYPMALDEESEPVGFDEYGRFAFIDPLANSYPGFIMTGDKVKILEHCPVCDRPGPVICGEVTRFSGIQDRGCGAALARMFSEEVSKNIK